MNVDIAVLETRIKEPAHWSLRLFGGFELSALPTGDRVASLGRRERALLTYLALSPKGRQPRRKLATLIWAEAQDQALLENLRTCLWRLRKALGDTEHCLIASEDEDIVLDIAAFDVDALNFERFAALSGRTELEAAAHLYGGTFLDGFELDSEEFESWRRAEASRYLDKAVDVLCRLMKLLTECGETEHAIEAGARILRLEPLHEATARHLMQLYAQNGRRGTAIQLYRTLTKALRRDVNAQPEAETRLGFALIAPADEQPSSPASVHGTPPRHRTKVRHAAVVSTGLVSTARFPLGLRVATAFMGAAIILGVLISFWWPTPSRVGLATRTKPIGFAADNTGSATQTAAVQIAVLPFDNLSGDPAQQFFSDGMTEEIAAALAKVPRLQLIARAPGLQLRDEKDVRRVGQTLGVRYVIKGSVRKVQNRVRITAQLIRTGNGVIVWSDSYDREVTDVFLVQENIAAAIAQALSISLGLAPGERLVSSRNVSPESYEQFLRARPLVRARFTGVPQAIAILEPLVARDPGYAPAWALLASSYAMLPTFGSPYYEVPERRQRIEQFWPKAEVAARRAIQLDPNLADSYSALARLQTLRGRLVAAEDLISKALALDSHNPDALALHMDILSNVGLKKEALATAQQLLALEPYVPTWKEDAAEILWENEQHNTAIPMMKSLIERPTGPTSLAMMYASLGRYTDAADVLETALKDGRSKLPGWENQWDTAATFLRMAPAKAVLSPNPPRLQRASFAYLYVGAPDHALDYYEDTIKSGLTGGQGNLFGYLWHASYAPVRKTERFKSFLRNAGIVDYWRQRGWPNLCRPKGADDFVCD